MQKEPHARKRCGAKTRAGKPCKNGAMSNGRCRMHGGKSTGAPPEKLKGKQNAFRHGLFAKYLPKETQDIVNSLGSISPLDILWENIKIQVASILRAQQIMYVESKDEMIKELKKEKSDEFGEEVTYEFQLAWDRQATFMNSQSRAMAELRNMIKQYDDLLKSDLATEEQKTRIELLKSKVPNQDTDDINDQIVALADLINNPAEDRVIDDE